jgi:hypothetical protein
MTTDFSLLFQLSLVKVGVLVGCGYLPLHLLFSLKAHNGNILPALLTTLKAALYGCLTAVFLFISAALSYFGLLIIVTAVSYAMFMHYSIEIGEHGNNITELIKHSGINYFLTAFVTGTFVAVSHNRLLDDLHKSSTTATEASKGKTSVRSFAVFTAEEKYYGGTFFAVPFAVCLVLSLLCTTYPYFENTVSRFRGGKQAADDIISSAIATVSLLGAVLHFISMSWKRVLSFFVLLTVALFAYLSWKPAAL